MHTHYLLVHNRFSLSLHRYFSIWFLWTIKTSKPGQYCKSKEFSEREKEDRERERERAMAGNDWVNSYLEAILDVGPGLDDAKSSLLLRERGRFSPTRYFVEEVITGFDETDLHRSWVRVWYHFILLISLFLILFSVFDFTVSMVIWEIKAAATRSPQERNTRLENMCWRIWNLARKKKQVLYIYIYIYMCVCVRH